MPRLLPLILAATAVVAGCAEEVETDRATAEAASPTGRARQSTEERANDLGFQVHRHLRRTGENNVSSPSSTFRVLAMLASAARGETAGEIHGMLGTSAAELDTFRPATRSFRALHEEARIFVEETRQLVPAFADRTRHGFGAQLERAAFARDPEAARRRINDDVARNTNGRIPELFPPDSIFDDTRVVIVDEVRFHANWTEPFDPTETRPGPFTTEDGTTVVSPMMTHILHKARFGRSDEATVVELSYADSPLVMTLVLPPPMRALREFEDGLTSEAFGKLVASLQDRLFTFVVLPRFRISPSTSVDLIEPLKALGVRRAFGREADLSGLAVPNGEPPLFVSSLLQGAAIDVDERGTSATAATGLAARLLGGLTETFEANRPFLFFVRDPRSGAVFFMGRVANPTR